MPKKKNQPALLWNSWNWSKCFQTQVWRSKSTTVYCNLLSQCTPFKSTLNLTLYA